MKPWSLPWAKKVLLDHPALNQRQKEILNWWLTSDSRMIQILGGERSGKSWLTSILAIISAEPPADGGENLYWIVGPDYLQCRPEFLYIYDFFKNNDLLDGDASMPVSAASSWSMKTVMGHRFVTRSSADIQKLASFSVNGVIMAEAAQQLYEVYLKMLGRLSETKGWMIISGTLERGLPWYGDLYKRWQGPNTLGARSFSVPTWSNTAVYPLGRDDPAIKELEAETPEDIFMERYGAEPRRTYGLVIPEFEYAKHVRKLDVEKDVPVELWIDPGKNCYAVLFVQSIGLYTHVLDRVYARGRIAHDVIPEVMGNKLFQYVDKAQGGVIDFAARQEHGNKSQLQLWQEIGGVSLRSRYIPEATTIETVRFRLRDSNIHHEPLVYFNDHFTNAKAPDGTALDVLAEFELWRWPDKGFRQNEARRPIDKNNHAIKALGYGLIDRYGANVERKRAYQPKRRQYWGVPA